MDQQTEHTLQYWVIGIIFSLLFMIVWLCKKQRNGKLTEDKVIDIITYCGLMSFVWPVVIFVLSVKLSSKVLFWLTQKLVKVQDE